MGTKESLIECESGLETGGGIGIGLVRANVGAIFVFRGFGQDGVGVVSKVLLEWFVNREELGLSLKSREGKGSGNPSFALPS